MERLLRGVPHHIWKRQIVLETEGYSRDTARKMAITWDILSTGYIPAEPTLQPKGPAVDMPPITTRRDTRPKRGGPSNKLR
jgi:hypothetical protein